ncbi:MAG: PAS-domain containing protein [Deltaproteobacteria bacterium]|nr:PAS-domain containing protein [Deltaproteobacteria bacterium]
MFRTFTCLTTEHDLRLVVVAGIVCFLASLAAINLFHRALATLGNTRLVWLATAGVMTGCGIWATHFIAMLAYTPGFSVAYNVGLTFLSLLAAMLVTFSGLGFAVYIQTRWSALVGGGIVGAGVAIMHYVGMWALEVPGHVTWSADLVVASIVLGMLFGMAALALASRSATKRATGVAALLLTIAIVSHHFTAMGAVKIIPDPTRVINAFSLAPTSLAIAIAGMATAVLGIGLASAFVDGRLRAQNARLAAALNSMAQGLCMFNASERLVVCNPRYYEMYGLTAADVTPGTTLSEILQKRIAKGTFSRDPDKYRKDFLAEIAKGRTTEHEVRSLNRLLLVMNHPMKGGGWIGTHEDITERRDTEHERITMQEQAQRRAAIEQAIAAFRQRVEDHLRTVSEGAMAMRTTATTLFANSGHTSTSAENAVSASNEASVNAETAAIAADELSSSIGEIARQLSQTTDVVHAAVGEAHGTNEQITALAQAAQKIGDVIKLIRTIAGQTNLLALNATIEAARAGEAGKGFAVVASEVKSLAVQTAKATEDISKLIKSVQTATSGAVAAIGRIASRMQEIDSCTTAVSAAVEEQSAATGEISQNVASASNGAKLVVAVLDEVAGAATETRHSAESVLTASQAVEAAATELRHEVEGFLAQVAA